ncbi:MAG: T9SS type A sorting domain-containing protein [Bacteroidota bacterium]
MKKIIIAMALVVLGKISFAQGLENIIVEKYYVTNSSDAANTTGGTLPNGAVTYRFFANLATGYKLQAVYGGSGHQLKMVSTAPYFNHTVRGASKPNWTKAQLAQNSLMLDSYFTVGAATNNLSPGTSQVGILKTEDNTTGTVVNNASILQNADPSAGIAISIRDGFTDGTLQDVTVAADPATQTYLDSYFGNANSANGNFVLNEGSIFVQASSGVVGMSGSAATNSVFLGQITTTGTVHYELNLQITNNAGTVVQNYVASNPVNGELSVPSLQGDLGVTVVGEPSSNGSITFGSTTSNSIGLTLNPGNGARRLLIARAGSAVSVNPTDGLTYNANSAFGTGVNLGSGNFVVADVVGSTPQAVTVTGLNASTTYHFRLVEYNGTSGAQNYLTSSSANASNTTSALGTTYNWNKTGAGPFNFNTAANWTPARTTPANDDILVFGNGTTNTIVSNVDPQTIARLLVNNNTSIVLQSVGASTLTIAGNVTGVDDFRVDAGSSISLFSSLNLFVASSATGNVYGNVTLNLGSSITAGLANGLTFRSGSACTTGSSFTGAAFGGFSAIDNSVVFASGSSYTHNAGNNPFQKTAPASNVIFQTGSNQVWNTVSGFDASGRTYGNLTINVVMASSFSSSLTVQNLVQGSAGQITFSGTGSSAINISGDVLNNSAVAMSLTSGTGNVNLTKAGAQVIGGSGIGAITFLPTLSIASGATGGSIRSLALNNLAGAGTLKFNAAGLNVSFTGTISGTPTISAFGVYELNVSFTGTGAIGNLKTNGINDLTINRLGSSSTLSSPVAVFGKVILTAGDLNSNGQLTLRSIANRQGIIPGDNNGLLTGNVNVERYIAGTPYSQRFLSCPVSGLTTNSAWGDDFTVQGSYPFTYNPSVTYGYVYPTVWTYDATNVSPETGWESANTLPLTPLTGVSATCGSTTAKTIDAFGPVNNGPITKSITAGFNILGNPYPSPIRWSLFQSLNSSTIEPYYYAYNGTTGAYGSWNGTVGTNGVNDTIYTSQGIYVIGLSAGVVSINNTVRFGSNAGFFNRTSNSSPKNVLKLNVKNQEGNVDQLAVYSSENGLDTYNAETDVVKLPFTPESVTPELSLVLENNKLAIKEFSSMGIERMIPLDLVVKTNGNYNFNIGEYSNIENNNSIYLVDALTNQRTKLTTTNSYNVELAAAVYSNRFFLNLVPENTTGVNEVANNGLDCYSTNNVLSIANSVQGQNMNVQILDLNGKQVFAETVYSNIGITNINLPVVAQGVYVVRMVSNTSNLTKKVLIK